MKHELPCELIRDLFPSYIDNLTSDVTNELLEAHVKECNKCREILGRMQDTTEGIIRFEEKTEIDFLRKTKKNKSEENMGKYPGDFRFYYNSLLSGNLCNWLHDSA